MCTRTLLWLFPVLCIDVAYAFNRALRYAKPSHSSSALRQRAQRVVASRTALSHAFDNALSHNAAALPKASHGSDIHWSKLKRRVSLNWTLLSPKRSLSSRRHRELSCKERRDEFQAAYNATVIPEKEDPCRNGKENCVVSIAVYCHKNQCDDFYTRGIKNNIKAMRKIFPGWKLRIYTDGSLPTNLRHMIKSDISEEVVVEGVQGNIAGMFWRLFAAHDPTVDRVSIRDSDNIVTLREKALVNEWIRSGKKYHAVRDHPWHTVPLLGAAWGVMKKKGEAVAIPKSVIEDRARQGSLSGYMSQKGGDQTFLWKNVWPQAKQDVIAHDSYVCKMFPPGVKPVPIPRRGARDIVGYPNNYTDEDDFYECDEPVETVYAHMRNNLRYPSPRQCRPRNHMDWEYN